MAPAIRSPNEPNLTRFEALPLRQRKFARTKLALLEAAIEEIRDRPLEEVRVKDLCAKVAISEASFFNYFPRKSDLLVYYIQLWSIEMAWHVRHLAEARGGLAAIEEIFRMTAARTVENPAPMGEIVAAQARMTAPPQFADIGLAERLLAFPDLEGVDELEGQGLDTLLPPLIERAVRAGELPKKTNRDAVLIALAAVFLGLPVVLRRAPQALGEAYHAQLQLLWDGLRKQS
jgi:AcrR family transcriptional regulator